MIVGDVALFPWFFYLWFEKNDQEHLTPFEYEYIAGYSLFNYGLARPTKEFLHLYFQIIHADFFEALGAKHIFADYKIEGDEITINKNLIVKRIEFILETWKQMYPNLFEKIPKISYKDFTKFSSDYFSFIKTLKLNT